MTALAASNVARMLSSAFQTMVVERSNLSASSLPNIGREASFLGIDTLAMNAFSSRIARSIPRHLLTAFALSLIVPAPLVEGATDAPTRAVARDAQGREVFVVELEYAGKKPQDTRTRVPHNPDEVDTDFYKVTFRNPTDKPITLKHYASGLRYGTGSIVGQTSASGGESWGAGLQPRDLARQSMFDGNVLAAGRTVTAEHFIFGKISPNYMDRVMRIEHDGATYEVKWEMRYSRGTGLR